MGHRLLSSARIRARAARAQSRAAQDVLDDSRSPDPNLGRARKSTALRCRKPVSSRYALPVRKSKSEGRIFMRSLFALALVALSTSAIAATPEYRTIVM